MRTIGNWLSSIGRLHQKPLECPIWPPDLFAVAGALLRLSGAYIEIFARRPKSGMTRQQAIEVGGLWRDEIDAMKRPSPTLLNGALPSSVRAIWKQLVEQEATAIRGINGNVSLARNLIMMVAIADEACGGIGIDIPGKDTRFLVLANAIRISNNRQSFGWDIPPDSIGVLPKQHTPQRGATLRSLTHHLALYLPNDIEAQWVGPFENLEKQKTVDTLNFLLVPSPFAIESEDFRVVRSDHSTGAYFEYNPRRRSRKGAMTRWLNEAFRVAQRQASRIDVVVFPELALSVEEYFEAEAACIAHGAMLISGVRTPARRGGRGLNLCLLQPAGLLLRDGGKPSKKERSLLIEANRLHQFKHHRWCLDHSQIIDYQLAGNVPPAKSVWENIDIHPRRLNFLTLGNLMTWTALVCEDLARQDPAADLIRSVGPNLLVALLMDGPQIHGRWSSRYASVLADDPGTSVLTLTSLGMAERCRPKLSSTGRRADKTRAIGLWKDIEKGEHEIILDAGDNACVLTVALEKKAETSADGREDGENSTYPVFAGYKSIRVATKGV
jgi:hypothetical protein